MFFNLPELNTMNLKEALKTIENYLRTNQQTLEYILTHLDSSNIIEIDLSKTNIYKGEENELQQGN